MSLYATCSSAMLKWMCYASCYVMCLHFNNYNTSDLSGDAAQIHALHTTLRKYHYYVLCINIRKKKNAPFFLLTWNAFSRACWHHTELTTNFTAKWDSKTDGVRFMGFISTTELSQAFQNHRRPLINSNSFSLIWCISLLR